MSRSLIIATLLIFVGGCAATNTIVSEWSNPEYASHSFHRIMVIGISDRTSMRRTFEDGFVRELNGAGYEAVPSYRFIPESGKVSEARIKEAVERAGADATLGTRLLRVEEQVQVTPGYYREPFRGFYGWYSHAWSGYYYEPPRVYPYKVYVSETTLYDFDKDEVVWSATLRTIDPDNFNEAVKDYAEAVIEALKEKNILAVGKTSSGSRGLKLN